MQTIAGGSASSSRYMTYSDDPLGVLSLQGFSLVPELALFPATSHLPVSEGYPDAGNRPSSCTRASYRQPVGVRTTRSCTPSQTEQRSTMPGACVYARHVASAAWLPQSGHVPVAAVRSSPKTSTSVPATAFPSSVRSAFVASIRPPTSRSDQTARS